MPEKPWEMPRTGEKVVYVLKALSVGISAFQAGELFWPPLKKEISWEKQIYVAGGVLILNFDIEIGGSEMNPVFSLVHLCPDMIMGHLEQSAGFINY